MKRFIRSMLTKEFLRADGTWTRDASEAQAFPNMLAVSKTQQSRNLVDVELVLVGETAGEDDIVLPLAPSREKLPFSYSRSN